MDSDFAAVWAGATATEKAAAADAVAKALEARKGLAVEIITATGDKAVGVLKEVYRGTPTGAALAAVEVLADVGGKDVKGTVIEPFGTTPDGTPAAP